MSSSTRVSAAALLCVLAGISLFAQTTRAASYQLTPILTGAFDPVTYNPIPGYDLYSGVPAILQFDISLEVSGLAPGQLGVGTLVFDIELVGLTDPGFGWTTPPNPVVDSNGPVPGGLVSLWDANMDVGLPDLKDIVFAVPNPLTTNPAVDPRWRIGQDSPANLGAIFVEYSVGGGFAYVQPVVTFAATLDRDGRHIPDPFLVPEPTTCVLAGLAVVGAAARRRV